jgi:hypothetical protein
MKQASGCASLVLDPDGRVIYQKTEIVIFIRIIGSYEGLLDVATVCWMLQGFVGSCEDFLDAARVCSTLQMFAECCKILLEAARVCWTLHVFVGRCKDLLDAARVWWTLQGVVGSCKGLLNVVRVFLDTVFYGHCNGFLDTVRVLWTLDESVVHNFIMKMKAAQYDRSWGICVLIRYGSFENINLNILQHLGFDEMRMSHYWRLSIANCDFSRTKRVHHYENTQDK